MTKLDRIHNLLNSHKEFNARQKKEVSNKEKIERMKDWTFLS